VHGNGQTSESTRGGKDCQEFVDTTDLRITTWHSTPSPATGCQHRRNHLAALAGWTLSMAGEAPALVSGGENQASEIGYTVSVLVDGQVSGIYASKGKRLATISTRSMGMADR